MALDSPNTGIVDYRLMALAYAEEFQEAGGTVITDFEASDITLAAESPTGSTEGGSHDLFKTFDHIISFNAPSLYLGLNYPIVIRNPKVRI